MSPTPEPHAEANAVPVRALLLIPICYFIPILAVLLSPRLQSLLTYFHFIRPPNPPSLRPHRLASHARNVTAQHLHGWHVLPAGPPFAETDADYHAQLASPHQTIVLFFHGTSGTRAFPRTRVALVKQLSAHLSAHVVTFDYSGYAESRGTPSERALVADAEIAYAWVTERAHPSARILLYGMSLGGYPALSLAAALSDAATPPAAVITDSIPSSLLDAAMSHPVGLPFRLFPFAKAIWSRCLREKLDNVDAVTRVKAPLLIMHAKNDWMVHVDQAVVLYNAAKESGNPHVEFVTFPDCGHNNVAAAEGYLRVLWDFVSRYAATEGIK